VTGNAADNELKPDAGCDTGAILDLNGLEAMSLVSSSVGIAPRVKGDIEFAWQTIERTLIQNMKVPRARIGPCIDELAWTDSCRCVPSHIADLSAPEPRVVRPKSCTPSTTWIAFFGATSRNCRLARVVTCA